MSNVVAGIDRGQLKVLDGRTAKNKEIYEVYKEDFKDIEIMNICDFGDFNYRLSACTI